MGYYLAGRFDDAIKIWEEVYKALPEAGTLGNLAAAAGKAGRPKQAIAYVDRMFKDHNREEIGDFLHAKSMGRKRTWQRILSAQALTVNIEEIQVDTKRKIFEDSKQIHRWSWMGWLGSGLVVAGLGGVTTAVVLNEGTVDGQKKLNDAQSVEDYDRRFDDFNAQQKNQQLALIGGVSFIALGTALVVWDLSTTTESYNLDLAFDGKRIGGNVVWTF